VAALNLMNRWGTPAGSRFSIRPLTSPTGVHGECDGNGQWPLVAKAALMHVLWKMKREAAESWGC